MQLLDGRTGEFTLTLFGRIVGVGDPPSPDGEPKTRTIPAPVIEVLDVPKQEGDFVVLPDPDTDVRLENIQNADNVLLMQAIGWLAPEQQPLAKGALRFRAPNYAANLVLTPRTPQVSARTITNVKVTPRAIEETILLNFQIDQAGIRRLSFYLPEALAKARLNVKLLKSKTVEPATDSQGQPIPGWVRFRIELQDYVRGQFGVVVMHDRLLTTAPQTVAIPRVETGRTEQRLVAIENAGRDEIDTEGAASGLEKLSPQQQTYRELAGDARRNDHRGVCRRQRERRRRQPEPDVQNQGARRGRNGCRADRPGHDDARGRCKRAPTGACKNIASPTPPSSSWRFSCPPVRGCGRRPSPASR